MRALHLCAQQYGSLGRSGKGLVRQYVTKVTGLSRAQVTRLIGQYRESGIVRSRRGKGRRFTARYSATDIGLLAAVDEAQDTLSGPATQKILYREFFEFADARYERLANISVLWTAACLLTLFGPYAPRPLRAAWERSQT
jgi:biotin operon repressor